MLPALQLSMHQAERARRKNPRRRGILRVHARVRTSVQNGRKTAKQTQDQAAAPATSYLHATNWHLD